MRYECSLCGRVGNRGFRASRVDGSVVCTAARPCLARYERGVRDAAARRRQEELLEYKVTMAAPPMSVGDAAMPMTLDYAVTTINDRFDLDLDIDHPAVRAMAQAMDDEWFFVADLWLHENSAWLRNIVTYPRECWCGQWPDLGTGCDYHGRCTCLERGRGMDGYRWIEIWRLRKPGRVYGIEPNERVELPGDCPVHPGSEVPAEHAHRLYERLRASERGSDQPWGRPPGRSTETATQPMAQSPS